LIARIGGFDSKENDNFLSGVSSVLSSICQLGNHRARAAAAKSDDTTMAPGVRPTFALGDAQALTSPEHHLSPPLALASTGHTQQQQI